jgi:hypothetical protein
VKPHLLCAAKGVSPELTAASVSEVYLTEELLAEVASGVISSASRSQTWLTEGAGDWNIRPHGAFAKSPNIADGGMYPTAPFCSRPCCSLPPRISRAC